MQFIKNVFKVCLLAVISLVLLPQLSHASDNSNNGISTSFRDDTTIIDSNYVDETYLFFTGFGFSNAASYAYVGGVTTLEAGKSFSDDGVLFRASAAVVDYDYRTGPAASEFKIDGDANVAEMMIGYQKHFDKTGFIPVGRATVYVGPEFHNQHLSSADDGNRVQGSEFGLKTQAEIVFNLTDTISTSALSNYSTNFQTYFASVKPAYATHDLLIGPEVIVSGNESFDEQKMGVYVSDIDIYGPVKARIASGYGRAARSDDSSYYIDFGLSLRY